MNRSGEGLSGGETTSKRVPHGEPYAGKLHVRFDEGYPQSRRRVAKRCTSRGAGVPDNKGRPALLYTLCPLPNRKQKHSGEKVRKVK